MDIAYPTRSQFLHSCETAIREHHVELKAGEAVQVPLNEGGYGGRVVATIDPSDRSVFGTDWEGTDPTRFPARIKAAAAALLNCGCEGRFEISHLGGTLAIRAV